MLLLPLLQIPNDLLILDSYIADPERSGKTDFLHMTHFIECLCSLTLTTAMCCFACPLYSKVTREDFACRQNSKWRLQFVSYCSSDRLSLLDLLLSS